MKELLTLLEDNQIDVLKEILSEEQAEDIAEFFTVAKIRGKQEVSEIFFN